MIGEGKGNQSPLMLSTGSSTWNDLFPMEMTKCVFCANPSIINYPTSLCLVLYFTLIWPPEYIEEGACAVHGHTMLPETEGMADTL